VRGLASILCLFLWLLHSERPVFSEEARPLGPQGLVKLCDYSLCDAGGPFLGLGVSYFQALRDAKYDRPRLDHNLAFLRSKGFDYLRVLTMVSWEGLEIAPVAFTNRLERLVPAWPDYWQQFCELLDRIDHHGLRAQVTIFADAQYVMPSRAARLHHLDRILSSLAGREHQVIHLEVANEAWQNGFPGAQGVADLRDFTKYLADRTAVLVAITSNDDVSEQGISSLYRGSAADLATVHFSRDLRRREKGWLPVRDCYRAGRLPGVPPVMSNEPIGPGASVGSENDPLNLCCAAIFAYMANLPGYVFHSRAGIYGFEKCCPPGGNPLRFEEVDGVEAFSHIRSILPPDLASWTRNDGIETNAPFTVYSNSEPNRYWPEMTSPTNGCVRNIGSTKGTEFISLPMGILPGGVTLEARRSVHFQVLNPLSGTVLSSHTMSTGERLTLKTSDGLDAYLLKGQVKGQN
jgi:hypothetical protein